MINKYKLNGTYFTFSSSSTGTETQGVENFYEYKTVRGSIMLIEEQDLIALGATPLPSEEEKEECHHPLETVDTFGKCKLCGEQAITGGGSSPKKPETEKCEYCDVDNLPRGTTISVDKDCNCIYCHKPVKPHQPETKPIELIGKNEICMDMNEQGWYHDIFTLNAKINELIKAVNELRNKKVPDLTNLPTDGYPNRSEE